MADKNPLILDFRNGRVPDGADLDEYYVSGLDDESANWDDLGGTFILTLPAPPPRTSTRSSQHSGQHCGVRLRESH